MWDWTRRFAVAGAIAGMISLAGVREASAQHRGGGAVHSGGGATHSSSSSSSSSFTFHSMGTMGQTFTTSPQFFNGRGTFVPNIFIPGTGTGTFTTFPNNGGSFAGNFGTPSGFSSPQYGGAPFYGAPGYPYLASSTVFAPSATPPSTTKANTVTPVSYGSDDTRGDTALLYIDLPADARLFFAGVETKGQVGRSERRYVTPTLQPGEAYKYVLRAEWTENGRTVERIREVNLEAGEVIRVDFIPPPA
jgi:uncharacterized protein (TIGR03000 family)